ncbi:hypothetical protein FBD94_04820 [Pedobacter hiemivivus]|uniref:Uncharacterized protein n=1 Tax=Pedobacter hiemivivus TaxID=2530454 RepID=A0A4R0NG27_9SPHI|nr:hypothetical protein [Pedobacter hiemivivus]TCC99479.1 hypothetical protein EZ444_02040 [Pedobacter hiemivivus]TKC63677.1 hypothetical protein FBD94_04820 [Pedobacter hiemivivus]
MPNNSALAICFSYPKKFRAKIIIGIFMLGLPMLAQAQLELYGKFNKDGSVEPVINYAGSKKISNHFAVVFFGLIREKWSQALIGLSYSPIKSLSFSGYAGIEHGQSSPRYSASVWWKQGKTSFLILGERGNGNNNYLYKVNMFHQFSEKISLGIMDWRYHGLGPNLRYTIPKLQSTIWIMPAYDHEQKVFRTMLGYSFQM